MRCSRSSRSSISNRSSRGTRGARGASRADGGGRDRCHSSRAAELLCEFHRGFLICLATSTSDTTSNATEETLRRTYALNVKRVARGWELNTGLSTCG